MQTTINFIPLDYDYFDFEGRNYAKLIGRTDKGKKVCIIDTCDIYIWAILKPNVKEKRIKSIQKKIEQIRIKKTNRTTKVLKTEIHDKNYLGKPVKAIKIFITNYKDAHDIVDELHYKEIDKRREFDLGFITKYILEKKVKPLNWYKVEGELLNNSEEFGGIDSVLDVDTCIKTKSIEPLETQLKFKPKVLAYDIETDEVEIGSAPILMISLVGDNFQKVLTWKNKSNHKYVENFKDEEEMLEAFLKYVKQYNPDILTGYFSDGFDLPYLRARAEKNKIKLSLGVDNSQPVFSRGRILTGKINGIVHLDIFRFIRSVYSQYLQSETLSLNEVASELLGEKKAEWEHKHSSKITKKEWENYFKYNLQDSILTHRLAEKLLPDITEFTKIIQEPLFNVSRDSMATQVENYLTHNMEKYNEIIEKRPFSNEIGKRRERERYEGAFVFQPTPGLYEDLVFFDFTSYWPSIIVTYNLSKSTFLEEKEKGALEVDIGKKVYFSKKQGFFPAMLNDIIEKRKKYKKEYAKNKDNLSKARSNSFKLLANASYGYQGFFGARYYCPEASASATAISRDLIKKTIEKIENNGHNVIYGDSVSGDTKVLIQKNNKIYEENIENLFKKTDSKTNLGKEYCDLKNINTLTINSNGKSVFKPIKYVMRHKTNKKMYRVHFTNNWYIDVTEDHSLIGYQSAQFNQKDDAKKDPLKRLIEIKPEEIRRKANSIITLKIIPHKNEKSKNYPKKIYEFMGFFIGDGSFHRNKSHQKANKDYYIGLSLGLDSEEIFNNLIHPLQKQGFIKNYWWSNTRKGDIKFNGLNLIKIIAENCRDKDNKKIIPGWLFEEKQENIISFLKGLFSADGTVMIRNNAPIIKFTSVNEGHIKEVRRLLYRAGISHSVFKENNINIFKTKNKVYSSGSYSKNILIKNKEDFAEKIGFLIDRKNKRANIKTKTLKKKLIKNFDFDLQNVKKIEEIKTPDYVYDIEVKDNHRFFANYVLVHNTDSIAFTKNKKSNKEVLELLKEINSKLPGIIELDYEGEFKRGIWVTKRTGEFGAKKKYALIDKNNKLKIRGFETVRRDWCKLARETQNQILQLILESGNSDKAVEYLKKIIKQLKNREISLKELIIRTQLKKPIDEYKSISPHVAIAKKMNKEQGMRIPIGTLIEYYISEPERKNTLIRERAKLPDEKGDYDINYYLKNQILPAVENIFEVFDIKTSELVDGKKQTNLMDF
jgi:DNA polymerase, archaea type